MDNKVLLSKLHAYGIRGAACNWFESLSNSRPLICGIPQGTILGPKSAKLSASAATAIIAVRVPKSCHAGAEKAGLKDGKQVKPLA